MSLAPVPASRPVQQRRPGVPVRAALALGYRAAVGLLGGGLVLTGLVLVPLPGPGWPIVFVGLAVLGSEFAWAARLRLLAQQRVARGMRWSASRARPVKAALLLVAVVCTVGPAVAAAKLL